MIKIYIYYFNYTKNRLKKLKKNIFLNKFPKLIWMIFYNKCLNIFSNNFYLYFLYNFLIFSSIIKVKLIYKNCFIKKKKIEVKIFELLLSKFINNNWTIIKWFENKKKVSINIVTI